MRITRAAAVGVAAAGLVGMGLAAAPVASAAPAAAPARDCSSGFACLYYNSSSNGYGAVFATAANISDYNIWYFSAGKNGSSGAGVVVKNNAAYVDNRSDQTYRVYYNSGYSCAVACQDIPAEGGANLNASLKNNNASGKFL